MVKLLKERQVCDGWDATVALSNGESVTFHAEHEPEDIQKWAEACERDYLAALALKPLEPREPADSVLRDLMTIVNAFEESPACSLIDWPKRELDAIRERARDSAGIASTAARS